MSVEKGFFDGNAFILCKIYKIKKKTIFAIYFELKMKLTNFRVRDLIYQKQKPANLPNYTEGDTQE